MTDEELQQLETKDIGEFDAVAPTRGQSILTNLGRVPLGDFLDFISDGVADDVATAEGAAASSEISKEAAESSASEANIAAVGANTSRIAAETASAASETSAQIAGTRAAAAASSETKAKSSEIAAANAALEAAEAVNELLLGQKILELLRFKLSDGRQVAVSAVIANNKPSLSYSFASEITDNAFAQIRLKAGTRVVIVKGAVANGRPTLEYTLE